MLSSAYLFALVLGGVLLIASIVMGGDSDADADLDTDADLDADADADAEHHGASHGDAGGFFAAFLSLRFWTFFAAFFGLTGMLLGTYALPTDPLLVLGLAIGMGALSGYSAVTIIRHFARTDVGTAASVRDYVGKSGRVLVPIRPGAVGKLRLELKGTTVDLLASAGDDTTFETGEQALVVQLDGTTAIVARLETSSTAKEAVTPS